MSTWLYNNVVKLKVIGFVVILVLLSTMIYGKWVQYETSLSSLEEELQYRNTYIDAARRDMVEVVSSNNKKIKEMQSAYMKVISDNKKRDDIARTHQKEDDNKFRALLNLYIAACNNHTTPKFDPDTKNEN